MNTIPSIFNERQIKRTVLGGKNKVEYKDVISPDISCAIILLNRGGNHYKQQNIENLIKSGFTEIVSVESSANSYNIEDFALRYPHVKFIVPLEKISIGDMINIGIAEITSQYALVLWNDIRITAQMISPSLIKTVVSQDKFCTAPFLQSSRLQALPVQMIPKAEKNMFSVMSNIACANGTKTLYPFDFMGFYNRQKFMQLGGYDYTITTPYWQNLDFSVRAWLWGEKICLSSQFKLIYDNDTPLEDITPDYTQLRFFLKNCAPVFKADYAYIPKQRFISFMYRHSNSPFEAFKKFADARKWVHLNRFRFKTDIMHLVQYWQDIDIEYETGR